MALRIILGILQFAAACCFQAKITQGCHKCSVLPRAAHLQARLGKFALTVGCDRFLACCTPKPYPRIQQVNASPSLSANTAPWQHACAVGAGRFAVPD